MKKLSFASLALLLIGAHLFVSCNKLEVREIDTKKISHSWYAFTQNAYEKIDLPKECYPAAEKPWTESVRISSAGENFALVNRLGILEANGESLHLYKDPNLFGNVTAGNLVFSGGNPVFCLYRSSFFNQQLESKSTAINSFSSGTSSKMRPFLVELSGASRIFFPLVTYSNLNLGNNSDITGFNWDGKTWSCSAKTTETGASSFKYFTWEPMVELSNLNPALTDNSFEYKEISESKYRELTMPKQFKYAPVKLRQLLKSLPKQIGFFVSYRDGSGCSAQGFYHEGDEDYSLNAISAYYPKDGMLVCLFEDGTTYILNECTSSGEPEKIVFRLPKLPQSFVYTDYFLSRKNLYIGWEENIFFKTARAGFLRVDLGEIFEEVENSGEEK